MTATHRLDATRLLQPAFLLCAAVLALATVGLSVARKHFGIYLTKQPLPLDKPLDAIDTESLAPYTVVARHTIENADILEALGTEDYLQWVLEDPREPQQSPTRRVLLFITYYARPDRVPHVPEECYTGGGYQRLSTSGAELVLGDGRQIPARCLVFARSTLAPMRGPAQFPVLYLFRVNGEYAGGRDQARILLNANLFSAHAYFCKVELVFSQSIAAASRDQATVAAERLLTVLLPVLEQAHWPDLKAKESVWQEDG
jgi:hypothetical protein